MQVYLYFQKFSGVSFNIYIFVCHHTFIFYFCLNGFQKTKASPVFVAMTKWVLVTANHAWFRMALRKSMFFQSRWKRVFFLTSHGHGNHTRFFCVIFGSLSFRHFFLCECFHLPIFLFLSFSPSPLSPSSLWGPFCLALSFLPSFFFSLSGRITHYFHQTTSVLLLVIHSNVRRLTF